MGAWTSLCLTLYKIIDNSGKEFSDKLLLLVQTKKNGLLMHGT